MKYILLQEGDVIKEGDEWWTSNTWRWITACLDIGRTLTDQESHIYRRPIPKVRLWELVALFPEVLNKIQEKDWCISFEAREHLVKSICTHLGIELEEEKEEWEVAFEKSKSIYNAAYENSPKDIFKLAFEAGQACERSKEK